MNALAALLLAAPAAAFVALPLRTAALRSPIPVMRLSQADLADVFRRVDLDRNGFLDESELAVCRCAQSTARVMPRRDGRTRLRAHAHGYVPLIRVRARHALAGRV
jgi:hypothetical protein